MAQFTWLGEQAIPRTWVKTYGPTTQIKVPKQDGTWTVLDKGAGFPLDQVITDAQGDPVDFTDERSLRVLRADPRYQEVI